MTTRASDRPPWHRRPLWQLGLGLVAASTGLTVAFSGLGLLGRWHWSLDLLSHFRMQYAVALAVAALVLGAARRPLAAGLALVGALANAALLAPLWSPNPPGPTVSGSSFPTPLTVRTYNLLYRHPDPARTLEWLRESPADIVFLCEVTPQWAEQLPSLASLYPHQEYHPRTDPFGCALLSRVPWTDVQVRTFGTSDAPSLIARFDALNREIVLVGMHPPPPIGPQLSAERDSALAEAAAFLAAHPVRTQILVGDLNASPWSHPLRSLLEGARLTDTALGHGWQPTWNVGSRLFEIPIDHVLVSPDLVAVKRTIGPELGSDHRAVTSVLAPAAARP